MNMKKLKTLGLLWLMVSPFTSFSYENPDTFCSVNGSRFTKLSCIGSWSEMNMHPEVKIKMKECFGFKSTERLQIEIDGDKKVYNSVIFPFKTRQGGYTIECNRDDF